MTNTHMMDQSTRRDVYLCLRNVAEATHTDITTGRARRNAKLAFWTAFGENERLQGRNHFWQECEKACESVLQAFWKDADWITEADIASRYVTFKMGHDPADKVLGDWRTVGGES